MNANELADELLRDNTQLTVKAAYMLRQQADRIAELEKQTKPLSDEEINQLSGYHIEIEWFDEGEYGMEYNIYGVKELVRAVEERHGIK